MHFTNLELSTWLMQHSRTRALHVSHLSFGGFLGGVWPSGLCLEHISLIRVDVECTPDVFALVLQNRQTLVSLTLESNFLAENLKPLLLKHRWPRLMRIANPGALPSDWCLGMVHSRLPRLVHFAHSPRPIQCRMIRNGRTVLPYNERLFWVIRCNQARLRRATVLYLCLFPRWVTERNVVRSICNMVLDRVDLCEPDNLQLVPGDEPCVTPEAVERYEALQKQEQRVKRARKELAVERILLRNDEYQVDRLHESMEERRKRIDYLQSLQYIEKWRLSQLAQQKVSHAKH